MAETASPGGDAAVVTPEGTRSPWDSMSDAAPSDGGVTRAGRTGKDGYSEATGGGNGGTYLSGQDG